jgi:hypothetical protein
MAKINLLGRSRRRRSRRGLRGATGCIKANGRLKKGCRWAKGRKGHAIRVK